MNILVVDDESTTRLMVAAAVKKLGHEVATLETGSRAWAAMEDTYFHVLITDWMMPEMDGVTLTRMLRAQPRDEYTYVIMLSARGGRADYLSAIDAGVDAFLVKPFDADMLNAQLQIAERIVGLRNHTQRLESIMCMCSYCRRVESKEEGWVSIERYIELEFHTLSSHTICPTCYETKVEPELARFGIKPDALTH